MYPMPISYKTHKSAKKNANFVEEGEALVFREGKAPAWGPARRARRRPLQWQFHHWKKKGKNLWLIQWFHHFRIGILMKYA